jgi:hypothetical protein
LTKAILPSRRASLARRSSRLSNTASGARSVPRADAAAERRIASGRSIGRRMRALVAAHPVRNLDRLEVHRIETVGAHLRRGPCDRFLERPRAGDARAVQIGQIGQALPRNAGRLRRGCGNAFGGGAHGRELGRRRRRRARCAPSTAGARRQEHDENTAVRRSLHM